MRDNTRSSALTWKAILLLAALTIAPSPARCDDVGAGNSAKARALVSSAIQMKDGAEAVKLLWQATDIDPNLTDAYVYLAYYYNSRAEPAEVIKVYKKLIQYEPNQPSAFINIGEAYMSFTPPQYANALKYYRKAYKLDPTSSFAQLRIGEVLAQQGSRSEAVKYLKLASAAKNPATASEAQKMLHELGAL